MKPISTSIYTFADLVGNDCVYVDKTRLIYKLVSTPKGQFFCARPRRFGKSLTISTLEALFRGRRELFDGLWIASTDYSWPIHPVIHIDFARSNLQSIDQLSAWLLLTLRDIAREYGVSVESDDPSILFGELIKGLYDAYGTGVVLLIDEYDKPIQEHVEDAARAEPFREFMESLYQMVKGYEPFLRFTFLTGVARFAKLSVFSKLNNLDDISMDPEYSCLMGYTQAELEGSFADHIDAAVASGVTSWDGQSLDRAGLLEQIAVWYDGFQFAEGAERVYNPVSVGRFFSKGNVFDNYWFDTGTPSFLMRLIKKNALTLVDLSNATMSVGNIGSFDLGLLASDIVSDQRIVQLLYQTGYLTLARPVPGVPGRLYRMRFPNKEVQDSFEQHLFSSYAGEIDSFSYATKIVDAAWAGDTAGIVGALKSLFAGVPYPMHVRAEEYWQSMVYTALRTCGMDVQQEVATNIGRIDTVMRAGNQLYLFEFKLDGTAKEAIDQIDERRYADRYLAEAEECDLTIHRVGVNFSWADGVRNIYDWREELDLTGPLGR